MGLTSVKFTLLRNVVQKLAINIFFGVKWSIIVYLCYFLWRIDAIGGLTKVEKVTDCSRLEQNLKKSNIFVKLKKTSRVFFSSSKRSQRSERIDSDFFYQESL